MSDDMEPQIKSLFLAECTTLTQMEVSFVIDGVHHKVACNKFEVISTTEINFREAIVAAGDKLIKAE